MMDRITITFESNGPGWLITAFSVTFLYQSDREDPTVIGWDGAGVQPTISSKPARPVDRFHAVVTLRNDGTRQQSMCIIDSPDKQGNPQDFGLYPYRVPTPACLSIGSTGARSIPELASVQLDASAGNPSAEVREEKESILRGSIESVDLEQSLLIVRMKNVDHRFAIRPMTRFGITPRGKKTKELTGGEGLALLKNQKEAKVTVRYHAEDNVLRVTATIKDVAADPQRSPEARG
jgi:hypothetical protein